MPSRLTLALALPLLIGACGRSGGLEGDSFDVPTPGLFEGENTPGPGTPTPNTTPLLAQCESGTGLIGCWSFDGNFADGSTEEHVASVSNVAFDDGVANDAAAFAANSLFTVPNKAAFNLSAMTVEAWILAASLANNVTILDRDPTVEMRVEADGTVRCIFDGSEAAASPAGDATANSWVHVACTFDPGNSRRVWVNGVSRGTGAADGGPDPSTNELRVGANSGGSDVFVGRLDVVRLWSRVLAPSELCEAAGKTSC